MLRFAPSHRPAPRLRAHAAYQFRIKYLYSSSREELYHAFNQLYPEFVQRIPQYLLASYLGFTPEYPQRNQEQTNFLNGFK